MTIEILLHQRQLGTVFDLLGDTENDLTYSLGWALSQSELFCSCLLAAILPNEKVGRILSVHLQHYGRDRGFTDIEVIAEGAQAILEAKLGWTLPASQQLVRYARRLKGKSVALVVLAECTPEYAKGRLPTSVKAVPVRYLSWKRVAEIAAKCRPELSHVDKYLLDQLRTYIHGVVSMQDIESNLVYVVALRKGYPEWSSLPWVEFVTKKRRYFHPYGVRGWPTVPPTYIAFRYQGRLQSIHHVDGYVVTEDLAEHFPEIDGKKLKQKHYVWPYLLYRLGPPIYPSHDVRTGSIFRNGRVRAALDLLLTSKTISEARDRTKKRLEKS